MDAPQFSPLLTTRELATHLRVTTRTIREWANTGVIPALRPRTRALRFDLAAVLDALKHPASRQDEVRQ